MDSEPMTLEMADEISDIIEFRQAQFDGESLDVSIKVVLFNYGDNRRIAHCIGGDWSGPKSEMNQSPTGLPACPVCGRVATEDATAWRLALVRETLPQS